MLQLWSKFVQARSKQMSLSDATLMPIFSNHFKKVTLESDYTVEQLLQFIKPRRCNVFLELGYVKKHKKIKDVILMEKVNWPWQQCYVILHNFMCRLLKSCILVLVHVKWLKSIYVVLKILIRIDGNHMFTANLNQVYSSPGTLNSFTR